MALLSGRIYFPGMLHPTWFRSAPLALGLLLTAACGASADASGGNGPSGVSITVTDPNGVQQESGMLTQFCADVTVTSSTNKLWSGSKVQWSVKIPGNQVFDSDTGHFADLEGAGEASRTVCWDFTNPIAAGDYHIRYYNPVTERRAGWTLTVK